MMARQLNGSGRHDDDDPKVASLDAARKRQAERHKVEQREARAAKRGGPMSVRDWVIGGVFVLMALGLVWHWLAPLAGVKGLVR